MKINVDEYKWPMSNIEYPQKNDAVYGRGGLANNHPGNKRIREIVAQLKDEYRKCSRHEKTAMAESIVKRWRNQEPPGRFLKLNEVSGLWFDVGDRKARTKCSQLLREGGPKMIKEGSEDSEVPPPPSPIKEEQKKLEIASPCSVMDR
jgi:hypothetical protein